MLALIASLLAMRSVVKQEIQDLTVELEADRQVLHLVREMKNG